MRKFDAYPIYVNFADRWEEVRLRQADEFAMKDDERMVNWLNSTGKELYEITEDMAPSFEARGFEHRIYNLLRLIASTKMGKRLFDSLNPDTKYWILPNTYPNAKPCKCGASEFPGTPKGGGGIRVYIDPQDWYGSASKFVTGDDILFHEMVHAYRDGRLGFFGMIRGFGFDGYSGELGAEEFFALQMQNVYLWYRGGHRFYRSYDQRIGVSKDTAYQILASDEMVLRVFRYFLDNDPLAADVARWKHPAESYNPWRDLPVLERIFLGRRPGLNRLPPFVPPVWTG
jgi:hypothetical protein